ncbi:LPXTG cell wall anchor domain-containing protein [Streptomyces cynarae]|uniref:LPXTG cell wall anchor domain-containing protein n=1 Tax=Streptomyces cynarae TaxID=2981134 RepID=A0ABY6EJ44_9ACTN|nr:LPXTG cell wall anchor domain-containing protein [Streptomyces cynarae]UXY24178.1 LPXTG cell wall anchor domain-containing protein [Streptomyces cynarae]
MSSDDPTTSEQPMPRGRTHRRSRTRRHIVAGAVAALLAGGGAGVLAFSANAAPTVAVTVDAGTSLGMVPSTGVGLNTAVYDAYMNDAKAASLMKAAGVRQLRFPGGSVADAYHWKTHTVTGGSWAAPGTDFDHFMATTKKVGAQPIVIANYGSGTAQEAADWVKYANVDKGYGVKYWEIGNEIPGNGHYGSKWEVDTHADKSPREYAKNLVAYAKAMKAVDPTVKIGAVLTTPGSWPDGLKASGDDADWNNTVLSVAGKSIDFVIIHWYPGGNSTADVLKTPAKIAGTTSAVRSLINTYAGPHAASVEIAVTETSSAESPAQTSQAAALFAPDTYMSWLEQGAVNVDWWDLHNGIGKPTTVDGETDYQDGGVLSVGSCSGGTCEPARETPFPTYWGIRSLTALARPGDTMVKASSANPSVAVHAVRSSNGGLNVMLINKSPQNAAQVSLSYIGYTPARGTVRTVSFTKGGTALTTATRGTAAAQTLPPYSITTLQLKPASAATRADAPSPAPTPAAAAPVASASGTIGTRAQASAAGVPVVRQVQSNTGGGLASTGASSAVTYSALGGLLAIAAGSVLVFRQRRSRATHGR